MKDTPAMTDIFQFMELRAPFSPEPKALLQNYFYDDFIGYHADKPSRIDSDLQTANSTSVIGRLVYEKVFCSNEPPIDEILIDAVVRLLTPFRLLCPQNDGISRAERPQINPLHLMQLERQPHVRIREDFYLLPERLEHIKDLMLYPELLRASEVMEGALTNFERSHLNEKLEAVFGKKALRQVVFKNGVHSNEFLSAKRILFDTLYLLYILRRRVPLKLEYVIEGLRVLHVMEALAIDSLIEAVKAGPLSQQDQLLRLTLGVFFPELLDWNGTDSLLSLPCIQSKGDFEAYLTATPVVHPIFARLYRYRYPFNDIKPIGIGDLKVVKQQLVRYLPGEIAHIENVLKGEVKDRTHRRLEKTEESFAFSTDYKESSQKDTQTTERFELKREVDKVVKKDLNIGANANLTYSAGPIVTNIGGSFGFKRDVSKQTKTSMEFSHETLTKAIKEIEKTTTEKRSVNKIFETEETNKHMYENNKKGANHISGIYRWLDKEYNAQLFNFGTRMMFEFVIPEPAAFFIESRIRAFESTLECPQPPKLPKDYPKELDLGFNPYQFTFTNNGEPKFKDLQQRYDLSEYSFPPLKKTVSFINPGSGEAFFSEKDFDGEDKWFAKSYKCNLQSQGYKITRLFLDGDIYWRDANAPEYKDHSVFTISVDGRALFIGDFGKKDYKAYITPNDNYTDNPDDIRLNQQFTPYLLATDEVTLVLGFQDGKRFDLVISAELTIDKALHDWWVNVFHKVQEIEQQKIDKENQEALLIFNTEMATYRNRLAELKAQTLNDLLQGQSEAFNLDIIRTELKKHCLTMLTKEFDVHASDDVLANKEAIGERPEDFTFRRLKVTEESDKTTCSFEVVKNRIPYPSIDLVHAKGKGRFIQFLEQAFEWRQLAYIFYPYFWATPGKWIEMMNRSDDADPNLTTFLQAGSTRVLLAVTPAYEAAVLHYIATREPWEGGSAPVIGDPLFIPLYEELRKQQDDLFNGVPEGQPWPFILPTSLVYLEKEGDIEKLFPDTPVA